MKHILDRDSDIVFLTEIWLTSDHTYGTALVKSYKLLPNRRKPRLKETGGGIGILLKTNIVNKRTPPPLVPNPIMLFLYNVNKHMKWKTFSPSGQSIVKKFPSNKKTLLLVSIYRLPVINFSWWALSVICSNSIVVAGDVNIHTETEDVHSKQLMYWICLVWNNIHTQRVIH